MTHVSAVIVFSRRGQSESWWRNCRGHISVEMIFFDVLQH